MKVVVIIQARMRSTRLPGKILADLCGRTVLYHDIVRVRAARLVDQVVVATSDLTVDDPVADEARRAGVAVFRGSENDVLARYCLAAREADADVVVRMTSDCPLFDPVLLDRMLTEFLAALETDRPYDYYSNTLRRRTYPTGLDAEIFTREALEQAFREGVKPHEREHVTPYLHQNPQLFRLGGLEAEVDHSGHRWTLDTPEDLELIRRIYGEIYCPERLFTTDEVLRLFRQQPDLAQINSHIRAKPIDPARLGNLLIRVDASAAIGAGHVMRCLALAQAWPREAGRVVFAMAAGADAFGARLADEGFAVEQVAAPAASAADAAATLALAERLGTRWLAVDGYPFDNDYFTALAAGSCRLLVLDDSGRRDLPAVDILLNQNLHAAAELYPGRDPGTRLLLGVGHVLLRREFLTAGPETAERRVPAARLLVTLGGGDPDNVSGKVLQALGQAEIPGLSSLEVRVLVGAANPHRAALAAQAAAMSARVEILAGVADMPAQYRWADLAVTAGGGTLWELAYLGVPAVVLVLADNQEPSSVLLAARGVVHYAGRADATTVADIARAVAELAADPVACAAMSAAGHQLIDGRGSERVLAALGQFPLPGEQP